MYLMQPCDICEATHVKTLDGQVRRIREKWGVNGRQLEPPSKGGFGVITEDGERITMWQAQAYYVEISGEENGGD